MYKTLRISFNLKNTYRVNTILYSLKQIPLIGQILPEKLYGESVLKIFANIISVMWEILSGLLGKCVYLGLMVFPLLFVYDNVDSAAAFLHILFFLTLIGTFTNTYMFNPTKDKYYAMFLLRMNAKEYTLINYGYAIFKVLIGFLIFGLLFGRLAGVPVVTCLMIPFFVAGAKMVMAALALWDYEKNGKAVNENRLSWGDWVIMGLFIAAAYVLPFFQITIPYKILQILMMTGILLGLAAIPKILRFPSYRLAYQEILKDSELQMDKAKNAAKEQTRKAIVADTSITSKRKGFEYLNELFIKRHQKILWKSSKQIAVASMATIAIFAVACYISEDMQSAINQLLLNNLSLFAFLMYYLNKGTRFTQALFVNCDHSLLTYSFYKQPKSVLRLFQIRQREIIKINMLPAAVIGVGLALLLYVSGGTSEVINYVVIVVTILALSIFFSVHYLVMYYLLQPYNAGTEIKSGTYKIVMVLTYFVCYGLLQLDMSTMVFGVVTIVFCIMYSVIACVLAYYIAPKTFKLRG